MSERDIGREILEGIRQIKAYKAGEIDLRTRELTEPSSPREIRMKLQLSQAAFARLMGVSLRTVQDWE
jgi:putative transcriptional regulator